MRIVYAGQPFPPSWVASIFLAGPTPRGPSVPSWRPEALELLRAAGFTGAVFVPESPGGERFPEYDDQVEWERQGLNLADRILFWIPRQLDTMPAFTTNVEFGRWCTSGKAVLGYPPPAPKMKYLGWLAAFEGVPVCRTLAETVAAALDGLAGGAERSGGERCVPLDLWRSEMFQSWYGALRAAGNRLDDARVLWSARGDAACAEPRTPLTGQGRPFAYVLHARVWVAAERRHKENEWVLARPEVSCAVLYHRAAGENLLDTHVVLVREFRTAGRTPDGFVHELPGGSHWAGDEPPLAAAVAEVREEVGLRLDPGRLRPLGSRQLAGTLSSHHAHAFAAELTAEEMDALQRVAGAFGVAADSERTYVEVVTVRQLLAEGLADWGTLGMVLQALA